MHPAHGEATPRGGAPHGDGTGNNSVQKRFAVKINRVVEPWFPERRVFLKSDTDTRFIRLRPVTQLAAYAVGGAVLCWAILATAIVVMDSIGSGSYREQAKRDLETYSERLDALAGQRDASVETGAGRGGGGGGGGGGAGRGEEQ